MQPYVKVYLTALGYDTDDPTAYIPSELEGKGQDIHHIIGRGKKGEDRIENLMALTRKQHTDFGDKKPYMVMLLKIHRAFLRNNNVPFEKKWFKDKIKQYEL